MKIKKKKKKKLGGGGGGGQGGGVGRVGGVRVNVIEVFGKIHTKKFKGGGSVWGVRVDVNEELKFL